MNRDLILDLIRTIVSRRETPCPVLTESTDLARIGFRSLDFAELCLRVEEKVGHELNLGAHFIRSIQTVRDICDLLGEAAVITAP